MIEPGKPVGIPDVIEKQQNPRREPPAWTPPQVPQPEKKRA